MLPNSYRSRANDFFWNISYEFYGIWKNHPSVRTSKEGLYFITNMVLSQIILKPAYTLLSKWLAKGLDNHQILGNCCFFFSECSLTFTFRKHDFSWCSISASYTNFVSGNTLKNQTSLPNGQKKISQACCLTIQVEKYLKTSKKKFCMATLR